MKRTIVVCDRCRKQFKAEKKKRTIELTWTTLVEVDLCDECYEELCKWMKNEKLTS